MTPRVHKESLLTAGIASVAAFWLAGLAALAGAACGYWWSLADDSRPTQIVIPSAELIPAATNTASWHLPASLWQPRWQRTGVRVWENDVLLPLRESDPSTVTRLGQGRFCVDAGQLHLSALDNSNPSRNGRSYRLEVGRPDHRAAIGSLVMAILAAVFFGLVAPLHQWTQGMRGWFFGEKRIPEALGLWLGVVFAGLSLVCLLQGSPWALCRQIPIPPEHLLRQADGGCSYYPPRWVRKDASRFQAVRLLEDGRPLQRMTSEAFAHDNAPGSYTSETDAFRFHPSGAPSPSLAGRKYELLVTLMPRPGCWWWGLLFGSLGLLLILSVRRPGQDPAGNRADGPVGPRPLGPAWWVPCALVVIAKLSVVAGQDSMAQVADGFDYARTALALVWGGDGRLPAHPSGFPFVAGLVAQIGLPWRLALELFYLAACCLLAARLARWLGWRMTGFLLFFFLAWHPWTLSGFGDFMSDPLVLVVQLLLLGAMLPWLWEAGPPRGWRDLGPLTLWLCLWMWMRHEGPLVYASYILFATLAWWVSTSQPAWGPAMRNRAVLLLVAPLLFTPGFNLGLKWLNYERYGIFTESLMNSPGLTSLSRALYKVRPERVLRYVPVTRQSLHAACQASPTLAQYEPDFTDPDPWQPPNGGSVTNTPVEFGPNGPFLNWVLPRGLHRRLDTRGAEQVMLKAAGEIELALRTGKLPARRAWYPFDPDWRVWLPELPRTTARCFQQETLMAPAGEPWGTFHRPLLQRTFNEAASRRAANIYPRLFLFEGVLAAPPGLIDSVAVANAEGAWLGASSVSASNWSGHGQPFDLSFPLEHESSSYRVVFLGNGLVRYTAELNIPRAVGDSPGSKDESCRKVELRGAGIALTGSQETFGFYLKAGIVESNRRAQLVRWETMLWDNYSKALWLALAFAFAIILSGRTWRRPERRAAMSGLLLVVGWLAGRAAVYGLLEANMGWGVVRYTRCVSPIWVVALFLAVAVAAAFLKPAPTQVRDSESRGT